MKNKDIDLLIQNLKKLKTYSSEEKKDVLHSRTKMGLFAEKAKRLGENLKVHGLVLTVKEESDLVYAGNTFRILGLINGKGGFMGLTYLIDLRGTEWETARNRFTEMFASDCSFVGKKENL